MNILHKIFVNRAILFLIFAFVAFASASAQTNAPKKLREEILKSKNKQQYQPPAVGVTKFEVLPPTARSNDSLVYLENADMMTQNDNQMPGITRLKGNVVFRYDDVILKSDSAYYNESENSFDAFGNVKIVQADTLTIYGDYLNYDGNTKFARMEYNVRMVNRNTVMTTDTLYYDRIANLAYYYTGGKIVDGNSTLTSEWGQYSPATKTAVFKDNVKMVSPEGVLTSDTLKYNTGSSIADIVGNSHIVSRDSVDVYSPKGWYDTKSEQMMLLDRSLIEQKDGKTMVGDTIFYDRKNRYGEAFSEVELNDPKQKVTLLGNFISYDEVTKVGLATDSARLVDWSTKDSLQLSADTLYILKDSIDSDTVAFNKIKAYKNVRFYRNDLQGMCDTLSYTSRDSILRMKHLPVVWSESNQLKGDEILAYIKNSEIDRVRIVKSAISIQYDSLNYYNQLAGKEIIAYLDSSKLKKVFVNGNAETIYFIKDDKTKDYLGVNKTLSSFITMFFKDSKVERILFTTTTSSVMYPLVEMKKSDLILPDFYWYDKERPTDVKSLFKRFNIKKPDKNPESEKRPKFPSAEGKDGENSSRNSKNSSNRNSTNTQFNTNSPVRGTFNGGLNSGMKMKREN